MPAQRANSELLWCLASSLALHASLITTAMLITMNASASRRTTSLPRDPQDPPLPPPAEMQLGLDAPNPPTPTWVGYEQYQKHLATHAPVEQAAFTDDPVAAAMQAADMRAITPTFDSARAASAKEQLARHAPDEAPGPKASDTGVKDQPATQVAQESPPESQPSTQPDDAQAAAPQPTDAQQPMARQESGAPNTGSQADRESDATSIVDVPREHWQLGKPLAAQGLELKPRRPDVTVLTQLTAWPRNPTARITFDKTGVPTVAVLLQDTGDTRVDASIIAALYRWRAAGKPLLALKEGETIDITIRLLINRERRRIEGEDG